MRIDSHAHIGAFGTWRFRAESLLRAMDAHGVDRAIVSDVAGNEFGYDGMPVRRAATQRQINEAALETVSHADGRLLLLYWISPRTESADALRPFVLQNRACIAGLKTHPLCARVPLDDARFDPFLDLCADMGMPLCAHTENDGFSDVERAAALARRHPRAAFIAVHAGLNTDHARAFSLARELPNFYADTTLMDPQDASRGMAICPDKLLFGSDAPAADYARYAGLFGDAADAQFFKNAQRAFGWRNV